MTLNIAAASKERAQRILSEWIEPNSDDIYVLTETSDGPGTKLLLGAFRAAGWSVFTRPGSANDRGVAVATRVRAKEAADYLADDPAPGRCVIVNLDVTPQLQVVGMYVPNRGNDARKTQRKQMYLDGWLRHLTTVRPPAHRLVVGDLNVVPPGQHPVFLPQYEFEYRWYDSLLTGLNGFDVPEVLNGRGHEATWVAYTGEGYTYDHLIADNSLRRRIRSFRYDHATREAGGITDHSALLVELEMEAVHRLHEHDFLVPTQTELF